MLLFKSQDQKIHLIMNQVYSYNKVHMVVNEGEIDLIITYMLLHFNQICDQSEVVDS